jgi:ketosteroid isomerase-like protein
MTQADTQQQVLDLVQRWAAAERAGDPAALDALLDADFVGIGPRGFVLTRDQWLDRYRSGALRNQSFAVEEAQVRAYGDAAISVGVQVQQTTHQGRDVGGRFRLSLVAVRKGGRWLLAGLHLSGPLESP